MENTKIKEEINKAGNNNSQVTSYTATIGLEIHAQLSTNTKLFSNSQNNSDENQPNNIVSPIDAAHPGTLPAINIEAIRKVVQVGLAIGAEVANFTEWDRKNYFYPDIPKAYQISQYKYPLIEKGAVAGFAITRIHLEEDTGKSNHEEGDYSLVDLNRAGMPLMELVTEPVLHSGQDAILFAKELQLLLRYLGVGEANLEKGEMRIEANISVSQTDTLGTKVEVKNINSFKAVEKAIDYEINRQIKLLEKGEALIQETRGWNENNETTFSQRAKEDAHDYRYFPDPDLPKILIHQIFNLAEMKASLPELPAARRSKLLELGITQQQIELLLSDQKLYGLFNEAVLQSNKVSPPSVANLITTNYVSLRSNYETALVQNITSADIIDLIELYDKKEISSSTINLVLEEIIKDKAEVSVIVDRLGLRQNNSQAELIDLAKKIISENESVVDDYKNGKESAIKFLIGQGMKLSKGQANPQILEKVIQSQIIKS